MKDNINEQLSKWIMESKKKASDGEVASYIPALTKAVGSDLGIAIVSNADGQCFTGGEWEKPFTLQSISKVLGLIVAIENHGLEYIFSKVDMEPTGDPFNSIARLETTKPAKPFNPYINAGAITICSLIPGNNLEDRFQLILDLITEMIGKEPKVNNEVYISEWKTADRNRALAYFLKDQGMLEGDVEETLELYFKQCSIEVNCLDLAWIGAIIANDGKKVGVIKQIIKPEITRIVKSLMFTCGMYNASGKFAVSVGIPSKSGVSGGILSSVTYNRSNVFPSGCGIGVYGPALDTYGNSLAGIHLLRTISKSWNLHTF